MGTMSPSMDAGHSMLCPYKENDGVEMSS